MIERGILKRVEKNYGKRVDALAKKFKLSPAYLKALIALECSGKAKPPSRLEKHVYKQLKNVRDGQVKNYGSIKASTVKNAPDDALKNLASSWGPFQLMGYQCIEMGINVADIRGENSLDWGVKWIDRRYGKYLKKKRYKDAFHIHNTGRPFPKNNKPFTFNKNYIPNGMAYIKYFLQQEKR